MSVVVLGVVHLYEQRESRTQVHHEAQPVVHHFKHGPRHHGGGGERGQARDDEAEGAYEEGGGHQQVEQLRLLDVHVAAAAVTVVHVVRHDADARRAEQQLRQFEQPREGAEVASIDDHCRARRRHRRPGDGYRVRHLASRS